MTAQQTSRPDLRALTQEWVESFNRHDARAYASFMAADCYLDDVARGMTCSGSEVVEHACREWFSVTPDTHIAFMTIIVSGLDAAVQWVNTGTVAKRMPEPLEGAVIGSRYEVRGVSILKFNENGTIQRVTDYWNPVEMIGRSEP
ncbi:nuclear transport factor 2 family protein [Streptomyces sp. FIT100]|uniref:nuclear transport factor 2 family protein n=1 Tax=Streptomyces sp. FIT100 TaxID=2837956 RepID=UPI0021C658A4|nr:nuclear transport factor 2 family protein [Streptomyces sp. FIT100]UUN30174.1 nuclear transport factor 2 family protein [Streptomyces sp. FIT100]